MPQTAAQQLIKDIESLARLDNRYEDLTCVNLDGAKRTGVCSLVFKARDIQNNSDVSIKFIEPMHLGIAYRLKAFEREPDILEVLKGTPRCVDLIEGCKHFTWQLDNNGMPVNITIPYFVCEWLDGDVESIFLEQQNYEALFKLKLFREIVLAVRAFHSKEVFHRDLKKDNFRKRAADDCVVAIDFGTAAGKKRTKTVNTEDYPSEPVGANAFSPPEAFITPLGSHREIGTQYDVYALGALLFDLFNVDHFVKHRAATNFDNLLSILSMQVAGTSDEDALLAKWREVITAHEKSVAKMKLNGRGNTIPKAVMSLLNDLFNSMVHINLDKRISLESCLKKIDSAIRVMENDALQRRRLKINAIRRRNRLRKIEAREKRLLEHLANKRIAGTSNV